MATLGDGTQITTVEDKEIVLTSVDGQYFRMKVADLAEAVRQVMPVATNGENGLLGDNLYDLAFKIAVLPTSSSNVIGDLDGQPSGYGWYNNSYTTDNTYAPGASAGVFIRLHSSYSGGRVTLFITTTGAAGVAGHLWYRVDGQSCMKLV